MTVVKTKLENLKPGKEYILSVRAKNADLNILSNYSDSIRFAVPTDNTIPDVITGLTLYQSIESVMFVFNYSSDIDIDRYEYELYDGNSISSNKISFGFNAANIFTIAVDNMQLDTEGSGLKPFWGRVRAVDTTNNVGEWTLLVQTDNRTPIIDNQFIGNLTASKITAGTIGAQLIQLNGSNSIIRSTTYTDTLGTKGWQIRGDGHFSLGGTNGITYDNETVIIGSNVIVEANLAADSISVGDAPNRLIINSSIASGLGGMTLGDPSFNYWYSDGRFRTGNNDKYLRWDGTNLVIRGTLQFPDGTTPGTFDNGDDITAGNIAGLSITGSAIYFHAGAGTPQFNTSNTKFWVDNIGRLSLGNKFSWNGSSLDISGSISASDISSTTITASLFKTRSTPSATAGMIAIIPKENSLTSQSDSIRFYSGISGETDGNTPSIRAGDNGELLISGGANGTLNQQIRFGTVANGVRFAGPAYSSTYSSSSTNNGFLFRNIGYGTLANRPAGAVVGDIYLTLL